MFECYFSARSSRFKVINQSESTEAIRRAMDAFNFEQLPDLCLRKIFAFLNLHDLVKCREVNRQFKCYADLTEVTELAVCHHRYPCFGYGRFDTWFRTDRTIDFQDAISARAFASFKSSPFKLCQQLKFLHVCTTIDLEILNDLKQLVHLEFEFDSRSSTNQTLTLPNLKVLSINRSVSFVLNTPKLEVLQCNRIGDIEFKYPQTIKRLECDRVSFHHPNLTKLINLEALGFSVDEDGLNAIPGHLSNWTGLKELHPKFSFTCEGCEEKSDHERIRRLLTRILHERTSLKRDDLKISLNDMLLIDEEHLPNFDAYLCPGFERKCDWEDWANGVHTRFRFINYKLIYYADFKVNRIDFCALAALNFEISEDFFQRFPRIRRVIAKNPVDREMFEWFLQNATELRKLELNQSNLDQAFFDRLPKLASRLTHLTVFGSFGLVTDFQFLRQLGQLEEFEADQAFTSFDLAATIFRESQTLKSLWFRVGNEFVQIERSFALEDDYSLQFFAIKDNEAADQTFGRENLRWSELATIYSRRTLLATSEGGMRIKRIRLE